jgi:O-antigen ligase
MQAAAAGSVIRRTFDRARLSLAAEWLAVAVAASLPWSTSATSILLALWLVALVPTLNLSDLVRSQRRAASFLPGLLFGLAVVGMIWSVAPVSEQLSALEAFAKLLVIPLAMYQFSRCDRGRTVLVAFLVSCTALMLVSWINWLNPTVPWRARNPGVPVKECVIQSGEFLLCSFALVDLALNHWRLRSRVRALTLAVWALAFLANVVFVATSRTSIIVFLALAVLLAFRRFSGKGVIAAVLVAGVIAASAAASSSYLRQRVLNVVKEAELYLRHDAATSTGYRLEFWRRSIAIIAQAPIIGHGTGSIEEMFRRTAANHTGMASAVTNNPHNQTLNIAVQLGAVGVIGLYAMWFAHVFLFWRSGFTAWLGLIVVMQNVISSLFNSQLFYFVPGWLYILGVGVLGGMMTRASMARPLTHPPSAPQ